MPADWIMAKFRYAIALRTSLTALPKYKPSSWRVNPERWPRMGQLTVFRQIPLDREQARNLTDRAKVAVSSQAQGYLRRAK
jgi:hypothetical protein